jgi:hypothetical protein
MRFKQRYLNNNQFPIMALIFAALPAIFNRISTKTLEV